MKPDTLNRRKFLKTLGISTMGVMLSSAAFCSKKSTTRRPNILFLFSDDHAYQAISAYGSRVNKTPNIDRIAREGIRFDNCCVSNSICAPSRAVILTGKHSHINGVMDNRVKFDGSQQTFPKLLQKAGYQTAIIGKWHLKTDPTGFDHWAVLPGQGNYYNPDFLTPAGRVHLTGYVTDIIADKAMDWLENGRDKSKPFVLMMQNKAPHRTWKPGPKYLHLYDDVTIPEPENLFDDYSDRGTAAKDQDMTIDKTMRLYEDLKVTPPNRNSSKPDPVTRRMTDEQRKEWNAAYEPKNKKFLEAHLKGKELVQWKYQRYMKDYLRCIASVDENVGRVLDYLDKSGLAEDTIVFYSSDQGFYLGEHGWFDKRFMYEESFKMPLLARWPGKIKPNTTNNDLASNLDFAETFLDLAGAEIPPDMQGVSLKPLLLGTKPANWRKSLYYHYYEFPRPHHVHPHEGVYDGRYKLINFYELNEWELYDLETDPHEMHNLYPKPGHAETIQRLKTELRRLRKYYKVPPNENPKSS